MKKVIIGFIKLKKDVNREQFEAFEKRVSQYNVTLSSHENFKVLRTLEVMGNDHEAPLYDYIEIIDIHSLQAMYHNINHDDNLKQFIQEFTSFVEYAQFLTTESIVDVQEQTPISN